MKATIKKVLTVQGENFFYVYSDDFYDAGNSYRSYYLPLYECHGNNNSFEYYYNGKVNIIG